MTWTLPLRVVFSDPAERELENLEENRPKDTQFLEIDSQTLRTGKRIGLWFIVNGLDESEASSF